MRINLKSLTRLLLASVLAAGCGEDASVPTTAPAVVPSRAVITLRPDSIAMLESVAADAVGRLVPVLGRTRGAVLGSPVTAIASSLAASDRPTSQRGVSAALSALDGATSDPSGDPDLAAVRLHLEALLVALSVTNR